MGERSTSSGLRDSRRLLAPLHFLETPAAIERMPTPEAKEMVQGTRNLELLLQESLRAAETPIHVSARAPGKLE